MNTEEEEKRDMTRTDRIPPNNCCGDELRFGSALGVEVISSWTDWRAMFAGFVDDGIGAGKGQR